ncbi:hypothetical protein HRbin25_00404 [bacterium HR25]|jgi:GNAT superfamily N-acetyltransferase|nr:hypothetical protein HRbin25_00404 [bacterium HR25]
MASPAPVSRVELRPLGPGDRERLATWCPGLAAAGQEMLVGVWEGEELRGALGYRLGSPRGGWCTFTLAVIEPARRGYGLGSESVRRLEEEAERQGARAFQALAPLELGLAFYFWLRLGYRPLVPQGQAMPMVREL